MINFAQEFNELFAGALRVQGLCYCNQGKIHICDCRFSQFKEHRPRLTAFIFLPCMQQVLDSMAEGAEGVALASVLCNRALCYQKLDLHRKALKVVQLCMSKMDLVMVTTAVPRTNERQRSAQNFAQLSSPIIIVVPACRTMMRH